MLAWQLSSALSKRWIRSLARREVFQIGLESAKGNHGLSRENHGERYVCQLISILLPLYFVGPEPISVADCQSGL